MSFADRDVRCPGCDALVRRSGLSSHRKTQACGATTASRALRARGFSPMGYGDREFKDLGIPQERAKTRRAGNGYRWEVWQPWWGRPVVNNWPARGKDPAFRALFDAFVRKLVQDRETERAFKVVWDAWNSDISGGIQLNVRMMLDFAHAAVGSVDADREVAEALDVLHRALVKRDRAFG